MTTALAVIDMQVWMFRTPERAAKLPGVVAGVNRALAAADAQGWLVYEICTEWPNDPAKWSLRTRRDGQPALLAGSGEVETVEGLNFPPRREIVIKTRHSAFLWTNFEDDLKTKGATRLLQVAGSMAASASPRSTHMSAISKPSSLLTLWSASTRREASLSGALPIT
jgi:nicotinamidase-related amidase